MVEASLVLVEDTDSLEEGSAEGTAFSEEAEASATPIHFVDRSHGCLDGGGLTQFPHNHTMAVLAICHITQDICLANMCNLIQICDHIHIRHTDHTKVWL